MSSETIFILLFMIATAVAIAVRRLNIPYTVALVLAGLLLGLVHAFRPPHLTKDLLYTIFLPGLLFEAAFHIDFQQFWRNRLSIASLAVPGVVAATALTTVILTPVADALDYVQNFSWRYALVFGALIAATDPIAVVAIFKELGAPKRLSILIEGESLLNDGTGIVFFTLSLSVATGVHTAVSGLALDFFKIVGFGLLFGGVVGVVVSQVTKQINEPMIEITLTTIAAYGAFVAAEHFGYSGVIATVTAGMTCGNYGARVGMSPSTRLAIESFWEYVAFALNSIVFLLIGFEVHIRDLASSWQMILVAYLAVTVGRALVIFTVSTLLRRSRERIPWSWSVIVTWGGLRGALPMVLALSLPLDFPHRDLLVTMTFGVVIMSILIHGLTVSKFLKWLGIVTGQEAREAYEFLKGKLRAADAALADIEKLGRGPLKDESVLSDLKREYETMMKRDEEQLNSLRIDREQLRREEIQRAKRQLLLAERKHILEAFHQGMLSQRVYENLLQDVDARFLRLETDEGEPKS
ncbi:MAG: Na+/H+ antiporter [Deltaproteobacteria bacterium]|jgi:CPA1 family monovalent cation:H+ antiporter